MYNWKFAKMNQLFQFLLIKYYLLYVFNIIK